MPTEAQIEAAAKAIEEAWQVDGEVPFPFYPRELRKLARAAIEAADKVRAPNSFQCADGDALRKLHRNRALLALAGHRCSIDLTDGFCGPSSDGGPVRCGRPPLRNCAVQAEGLLQALESRGISVVWDHDPNLVITMEKRT